jgi:hypothetical protein
MTIDSWISKSRIQCRFLKAESRGYISLLPSPRNRLPVASDLGHCCPPHTFICWSPLLHSGHICFWSHWKSCVSISLYCHVPAYLGSMSFYHLCCFNVALSFHIFQRCFHLCFCFIVIASLIVFFNACWIIVACLYIRSYFPCDIVVRKLGCLTLRRGRKLRVKITVPSGVT